jgi:hypothetical protein
MIDRDFFRRHRVPGGCAAIVLGATLWGFTPAAPDIHAAVAANAMQFRYSRDSNSTDLFSHIGAAEVGLTSFERISGNYSTIRVRRDEAQPWTTLPTTTPAIQIKSAHRLSTAVVQGISDMSLSLPGNPLVGLTASRTSFNLTVEGKGTAATLQLEKQATVECHYCELEGTVPGDLAGAPVLWLDLRRSDGPAAVTGHARADALTLNIRPKAATTPDRFLISEAYFDTGHPPISSLREDVTVRFRDVNVDSLVVPKDKRLHIRAADVFTVDRLYYSEGGFRAEFSGRARQLDVNGESAGPWKWQRWISGRGYQGIAAIVGAALAILTAIGKWKGAFGTKKP